MWGWKVGTYLRLEVEKTKMVNSYPFSGRYLLSFFDNKTALSKAGLNGVKFKLALERTTSMIPFTFISKLLAIITLHSEFISV